MNENLKKIQDLFQKKTDLNEQDKETLIKAIADADKQWAITEFKLERTEKVKRTTAILLEETIEELEQKRKAVELQNHELEIESCLERVRKVAMSMNRPDDMLHVCQTISEQLELLKVKEIRNVQTAIFYKDKGTYMNYEYYAKHHKTFITETTYTDHEIQQTFADKMLKGNGEFMVAHIKGDEVKAWLEFQKTTNVFIDDYLSTASSLNYYWFSLGPVALGISTYVPLTEEEINLFKRFLKVFELSYRRYLDIEKAEAQAYEANVEASLEKVRAVAMSMNKPDDLLNICETLYKEFAAFGFADLRNAMINIHNDENKTFVNYDYSDEIGKSTNHLHYDLHPVIKKQIKQIRTANDAFSETVFTGKDLTEWKKFRKKIGEKDDMRIKKAKALYYYFYSIGTGSIGISTFSIVNEKNLKLLKRFRNVFSLSYKRYIDLALAKAQAREAQIEASLERVRSRSAAMHKSNELAEVVMLLNDEIDRLGIKVDSTSIITDFAVPENGFNNWIAVRGMNYLEKFHIPYPKIPDPVTKKFIEAKASGLGFYLEKYTKAEKNKYFRWLYEHSDFRNIPEDRKQRTLDAPGYRAAVISKNSALIFYRFMLEDFTDENSSIFKRFGKIFEQTYTRFLDLQKAEAQARESQIQLALERVRARTMAMQKSDELAETASVLFKQLIDLGIKPAQMRTCAITTLKTDEPIGECWITSPDGNIIPHSFMVPYNETSAYKTIYAAWKSGEKFLVVNLSGKALLQHLNFLKKYAKIPTQQFQALPDQPKETFTHAIFFSQGYLFIISNEPLLEYHEIFKRFGAIFQQTYTRFLDLKKAEDQARESQIQLALERVRARTMAMQKSDELSETVFILFQQFKQLGENPDQATIGIINEKESVIEYWVTMYGKQQEGVFKFPIDEPHVTKRIYDAWKENKSSLVIDLSGKELFEFSNFRASMGGAKYNPDEKQRIINVAFFSKGLLNVQSNMARSEESIQLLERFAKVFEQTYTRFLDLQKAETQAREAQIEAALEKVRSRSMAMHKSEELKEVIRLVLEQFIHLKVNAEHAGFYIDYKAHDDMHIWLADPNIEPFFAIIPYFDSPTWNSFLEAKSNGTAFHADLLDFEEKNEFYKSLFKLFAIPEEAKEFYLQCKGLAVSTVLLDNVGLYIENFSGIPYSDEENKILMRFGKVFQQTYTRFLDLQKAEAQSRESQIQLAMERVRARTMAMQHSQELLEVIKVVSQQLQQLAFRFNHVSFGINNQAQDFHFWTSMANTVEPQELNVPYINNPVFENIRKAQKEQLAFFTDILTPEENNRWTQHMLQCMGEDFLSEDAKSYIFNKSIARSVSISPNIFLIIAKYKPIPFSEEENDILKRFGQVFDQSYTRFLDLQKAEAQAREAQIEAALERVRSRAMAMHLSKELKEVAREMRSQLYLLGQKELETCAIHLWDESSSQFEGWAALRSPDNTGEIIESESKINFKGIKLLEEAFQNYRDGKRDYLLINDVARAKEFFEALKPTDPKAYKFLMLTLKNKKPQDVCAYWYISDFKGGSLVMVTMNPPEQNSRLLLRKFANVFEQAYTRFLDLQKAEAQAREAQIEAALERVRSRSLAMHKSDEMDAVMEELLQRVKELEIDFDAAFILEFKNDAFDMWSGYEPGTISLTKFSSFDIDINYFKDISRAKKGGEELFTHQYSFEEKNKFFSYLFENTNFKEIPEDRKQYLFETKYYTVSIAFAKHTAIQLHSYSRTAFSESENEILKRFVKVFEQAYTRFLDLQKAEAQSRESQIEASLERVRSHAMAMHNSNDLAATANLVFVELQKLGIQQIRSGVGLIDKQTRNMQVYSATSSGDGSLALMGELNLSGHTIFEKQFESWLNHENYFASLKGDELDAYYKIVSVGLGVPLNKVSDENEEYGHWIMFSEGFLYAWSHQKYSDEEIKILERFKNVIELTFRRYDDLQKAETSAKEAIKQSALDRIRADIASMRTTNDLERITPLIWNELTVLGIPFIRCGVFIMDEEQQQVQTFLYTEGKTIASFTSTFSNSKIITEALPFWRRKEIFKTHWDEAAFLEQAKSLVEQGSITSGEKYLTEHMPTDLYLHFLPFLQGMLYVGDAAPLSDDHLQLVQALAEAFSTAYARYEDFNKLEAAKQQVDKALSDLKQTQTQLIQSEKMASLGELTAGIAHEIQNPLNFVNNFSEVNAELIEELQEERNKEQGTRDEKLENEILNDIKENEKKINHHGKRADAIVKGMLQHSRSSTNVKELTDINKLADEYLRLAYHGLRAKEKEFNATLKTDYDETIEKINIIPQDIGRVLLNLYTNAFYAVAERRKAEGVGYEAAVKVSTKKSDNKISISVSDNGNGIPQKIVDKIFQPFFTTKPTGQGTGLGLSLSYDIIKAHGGEIKVETKEGEGSEFTIHLSIISML